MTFTGRIRLYLVIVALVPPILIMGVVYFYSAHQERIDYQDKSTEDLQKLISFRLDFSDRLNNTLEDIIVHSWFERSTGQANRGRSNQISFDDLQGFGLDFYELLDDQNRVIASAHRPGLVGETLDHPNSQDIGNPSLFETVEYDIKGRHAALTGCIGDVAEYRIYAGIYLNEAFCAIGNQMIRGRLSIHFLEENLPAPRRFVDMDFGSLYQTEGILEAAIFGSANSDFLLLAKFEPPDHTAVFASFVDVVTLVALVSVLAAMTLGMYIAHRTRKEFDNLIDAFNRVATGNLNATVMAYSEGEFSDLADSFSEMTTKLRRSQQQLATSEKIAAWQAMARKIAHEIKNPLTPIGIGAEDLRRSYQEKLPHFDQTLDKNTRMIKSEINRLTRLLDEFVSFARMRSPEIREIAVESLLDQLASLYTDETSQGRLKLVNHVSRRTIRADTELIQQVLINLVKNSLEADERTKVIVMLEDSPDGIQLSVSDNGPGFSDEILASRFQPYLSSKKSGSGLGLVVCQRIVHDHDGNIELTNQRNGGAKVTMILPQD